jgi:hypothetical protein
LQLNLTKITEVSDVYIFKIKCGTEILHLTKISNSHISKDIYEKEIADLNEKIKRKKDDFEKER